MPWGFKNTGSNQSGLTPSQKKRVNRIVTDVSQEAKRRVQKNVKANNQEGNKGKR